MIERINIAIYKDNNYYLIMNELNILFKARNTVLEMLADRGYSIPDDINCLSIGDLRKRYMNKNCDIHVDKPNPC